MTGNRKTTPKQSLRLCIDGAMLFMLFGVMAYSFTGNALHEWGGIVLTTLFIAHIALNISFFKHISKGKYNFRRTSGLIINTLMLIALLTLIGASLPISLEVFPWFHLFTDEMLPAQIHILAGNWLFVTIALHVGMQWHRLRTLLPQPGQTFATTLHVALPLMASYGVWAAWQRNLLPKLAMYYTFDIWRGETSILRFMADYIGIFTLIAMISYYLFTYKRSSVGKQRN